MVYSTTVSVSPKVGTAKTAAVTRGVKFMRKIKGPQWWKAINPKTLRMDNTTMCVLGQAFAREVTDGSGGGFFVGVSARVWNWRQ